MRTIRFLACVCLALAGMFASNEARADQTGVAYDEIRWRGVDVKPLAPGSFQSDRDTLMKRVAAADTYPDLAGNLTGNLGVNFMETAPAFSAIYRYAYLGDLVRVDDPIAQTATIARPDLGQTIYLNLKTKTYHTAKAPPPPPADMPAPSASISPSPVETPHNYRIAITSETVPSIVIEGVQTVGTAGDGTLTTLQSTPTCMPMQGSVHWVLYQSVDYPTGAQQVLPKFAPPTLFHCGFEPTVSSSAPLAPHLFLYMSIEMTLTVGPLQIRPITTVIERGNVARLGSADAALFDIPADFVPQGKVARTPARLASRFG